MSEEMANPVLDATKTRDAGQESLWEEIERISPEEFEELVALLDGPDDEAVLGEMGEPLPEEFWCASLWEQASREMVR